MSRRIETAEPASTLDVRVSHPGRATVIALNGELDIATVPVVRRELIDLAVTGHVDQLVDLARLTFLDSAGLGALVSVRRRLRILQGRLVLAAPNDAVLRLLRLTSMDKVLPVHPTVDKALAAEFSD